MTRDQKRQKYIELLQPAFSLVVDQLIYNETKHGEGITLSDYDIRKAIGHSFSSMQGLSNDEPFSHAVAALTRATKVVLAEIRAGESK